MPQVKPLLAMTLTMGLVALGATAGQELHKALPTVTDQDRADIQELVAHYARALASCAAEEYAGLFAAPDGYFASGPRGHVEGHEKLVALVRSERHCNEAGERRASTAPTVVVQATPDGVTGRAAVGSAGHYEDLYVKTSQGWRFKARSFISAQEEAAKLTAEDFIEIRRLAGNDSGQFEDVYSSAPEGKRFRSSGVVIAPSPEGATGRAFLRQNAGHYDDVYEKTSQGWRFKSRVYVAPTGEAAAKLGSR
jgi:SnoaL-like protein